jgi:hypothetical protein
MKPCLLVLCSALQWMGPNAESYRTLGFPVETNILVCSRGTMDEKQIVGFVVLTAVVIKSSIFWDITTCSLLEANLLFGRTYGLHLQDSISRTRYLSISACSRVGIWSACTWRWRQYIPSKLKLTLSKLHSVTSQMMVRSNRILFPRMRVHRV